MKPFLYIGILLMTGASVYGFADYKKSKQKVSTLYNKNRADDIVKSPEQEKLIQAKVPDAPVAPSRAVTKVNTKKPPSPPRPSVVPEPEIKISQPDNPVITPEKETAEIKKTAVKENPNRVNTGSKKKKKVSYKMYSRAALDDEYLERDLKKKIIIKEPVTTTEKEQ